MDRKKRQILGIVFCLILLGYTFYKNFNKKEEYNEYQTNYFDAINKDYKSDDVSSRFLDAQKEVDKDVRDVSKSLLDSNNGAKILFDQFMDLDTRSNKDLDVLKEYIDNILNSENINVFIDNAFKVEYDLDVDVFTNRSIMADMKDVSHNIVYFEPITMDFGADCYYYTDRNYDTYAAYFKKYGIMMMEAYGLDTKTSREISTNIFALEKDICSASYGYKERTSVDKYYNVVTKDELKSIYSNIDIDRYLSMYGLENQPYYSVVDKGNLEKFNSLLVEDNLDILKKFVVLKVLEQYGGYLKKEYLDVYQDLYNFINMGRELETYEDVGLKTLELAYTTEVSKNYANKYFSDNKKNIIENLIKDILSYYKESINNNKWMSENTKGEALAKIDNMKIHVGMVDMLPDYEDKYNITQENSLIQNIININNIQREYRMNQLNGVGFDLEVPITTVNAYYNVLDNSINFPVAVGVMFDEKDDYYCILGSMGMIIGHEITHAFSSIGSEFDDKGNLSDWWTKEDRDAYLKLQNKVSDYYSSFEVAKGVNLDGVKTLDENIADLGGIHAVIEIAKSKNAKEEDYKKLFESYARMWADNFTSEYLIGMAVMDTHSPNRVRVNAPLGMMDKFKETYGITEDMPMYREESIIIW